MPLVGIDLGTTNTVVSIDQQIRSLGDDVGRTLPSVVAFLPNGSRIVGASARRRRAIDCPNTIYSSKRIIGRRMSDGITRNFVDRYPFEMVTKSQDQPAFRTRSGDFTPTEIASFILTEILERSGLHPTRCETVITVPASFSDDQQRATADAAAAVGLGYPRLVDEASATALAYLHAGHHIHRNVKRALVYDLGGGTFDCAVIDCSNGMPRLLAHTSDLQLGGDDIDHELAEWVCRHVLEKHKWDLSNYSETYDRLLAHCEEAKIALATSDAAPILLSQVDPECPVDDGSIVLTQRKLGEVCQDLVRRSFIACDDVLRSAEVTVRDIDAVLLAGGTTLLPMIQDNVEAYFGHPGLVEFDPKEVVAVGAGLAGCFL
jgi:molecular chaperone DnaK